MSTSARPNPQSTQRPNPSELPDEVQEALNTNYEWKDDTMMLVCTSYVPDHPAYGMTFDEYKKNRVDFMSPSDVEKISLSFRLPPLLSQISTDTAYDYNLSYYKFLTMIIEIGMIYLQQDYHEEYSIASDYRTAAKNDIKTEQHLAIYEQIRKQTITIDVSIPRTVPPTHPMVVEWLANAATEYSNHLNMGKTEFINLCWAMGVVKSKPKNIPDPILVRCENMIKKFEIELKMYCDRIVYLRDQIK